MNNLEQILEKINPLMDELSEVCKTGTFELLNWEFTVKFIKKASEIK